MAAPTVRPLDRAVVLPPERYRPGGWVWVWRQDRWRPGVVLGASPLAVLVSYQPAELAGADTDARPSAGTATDTVTAPYVMARIEYVSGVDGTGLAERLGPAGILGG